MKHKIRKSVLIPSLSLFFIGAFMSNLITTHTYEECEFTVLSKVVNGESLEPVYLHGDIVKIQTKEECYVVNKGDVVVASYAGLKNPVIKMIAATGGDILSLQKNQKKDIWFILLNQKLVRNSEGVAYQINNNKHAMLSLYQGEIAPYTYLLLGNDPSGSIDSTMFGLVHKTQILGKVIK